MSAAFAIIWQEKADSLWYAQEQGVNARRTLGGYATKEAAIRKAAEVFGKDVRLEIQEDFL